MICTLYKIIYIAHYYKSIFWFNLICLVGPTCLLRRNANSGGPIPSPMHTRPSSVAMLGRRGGWPARGGGGAAAGTSV